MQFQTEQLLNNIAEIGEIMMLIDTHVHLNDEQYDEDLNEVISRAREQA